MRLDEKSQDKKRLRGPFSIWCVNGAHGRTIDLRLRRSIIDFQLNLIVSSGSGVLFWKIREWGARGADVAPQPPNDTKNVSRHICHDTCVATQQMCCDTKKCVAGLLMNIGEPLLTNALK